MLLMILLLCLDVCSSRSWVLDKSASDCTSNGSCDTEYGSNKCKGSGQCLGQRQCQLLGGHYWQPCSSVGHVCCYVPAAPCSLWKQVTEFEWTNPGFPRSIGHPSVCSLSLVTSSNTCAIRLEILDGNLTPSVKDACYEDVLMVVSSSSVTLNAPLCGRIEGFATVVETEVGSVVTVVAVTQNVASLWRIRITNIPCNRTVSFPELDACGLSRVARLARLRWDKTPSWLSSGQHGSLSASETLRKGNQKHKDTVQSDQHNEFDSTDVQKPNSFKQYGGIFQQNQFDIVVHVWKPARIPENDVIPTVSSNMSINATHNSEIFKQLLEESPEKELIPKQNVTEVSANEATIYPNTSDSSNNSAPLSLKVMSDGRILGGVPLSPHQLPWLVALLLDGELQCGAALISHHWVLTAAHCVRLFSSKQQLLPRLSVYLGAHELLRPSEPQRIQLTIKRVILHPGHFDSNADIALLQLNQSVPYSPIIRPVCLPITEQALSLEEPGSPCLVAGWGKTGAESDISAVPLVTTVHLLGRGSCRKIWPSLPANTLCTDTATCNGDSGGALVAQDEAGLYYALGITSFGAQPCGTPGIPDVYTRISSYLRWISLATALD